jgi:LysM repeat protein
MVVTDAGGGWGRSHGARGGFRAEGAGDLPTRLSGCRAPAVRGPATQAPDLPGRRPAPVRLTARGRVALFLVMLALAAGGSVAVATAGQAADAGQARPVAVVQPGDTLWSIALRTRPGRDPFTTIEAIRGINRLPDYTIHPGQRLRLPGRR